MARTTVLSPHPDDAVLSLWHLLAGEGDVQIVNLFTGAPSGHPVSYWDLLTGVDGEPSVRAAERLDEDRRALALAGRSALNLGFLDAQYRNGVHPFGDLIEQLTAVVSRSDRILAPAALGFHEDHRLARAVALELRSRGYEVGLYADLPHAVLFGWPASVTGDGHSRYMRPEALWEHVTRGSGVRLAELEPDFVVLESADRLRKLEAVRCYRTQVPVLEQLFCILSRPQVLGSELTWALPPTE